MFPRPSLPFAALAALTLLTACPDDPGSDTQGPDDTGSNTSTSNGTPGTSNDDNMDVDSGGTDTMETPGQLDGECPVGEAVGHFDVILEEAYSAIDGEIRAALVQTAIITEEAAEGECVLLKRENPFCDPPCGGGEACSNDATCVPFPERIEVGTVTITGLEVDVSMEPAADSRYFETKLPHPVITPGAQIELTADGLNMSGYGFSALSLVTDELLVSEGTDLEVSWTPEDGEAHIHISVNIDQHGLSPTTLFCNVPDTGSYAVPAALIDALRAAGISGFPSANIYRQTIDSTNIGAGCIEFRIRARTPAALNVDGHTPCMVPEDCPEGQTCNLVIQTCE